MVKINLGNQGVMYCGNDGDTAPLGEDAGDMQDFARRRLDWKISHGARINSGRTLPIYTQNC
jgi:hypothetical protein